MLDRESVRKNVIDETAATGRTVMVIGRVDTGKSTFCRQLASAALKRGRRVGIVDADVGQSWIGPPTTVGMKIVTEEPRPTLFPDSFYFVGNTSPERHLLQTTVGAKRMVEAAKLSGADLVIIDTTGLVDGPIGRALKLSKIDLIGPDHIVCFQRDSELETLIKGIPADCGRVHRLEPSKNVERKTQEQRSRYRQEQFSKYFEDSIVQEFQFSKLRGQREIFLNGRKANERELENLSAISNEKILYAEWSFRGLFIVTVGKIGWLSATRLCSQLKIDDLSAKTLDDFRRLLVALIDERGEPLCLGLIEEIDFRKDCMMIRCKDRSAESAKVIQFSNFRLSDLQL